jgi:hypothetical protein
LYVSVEMNARRSNANEKSPPAAPKALVALVRLLAREAARQVVEDATACFEANHNTHSDERK